MWDAIMLLDHGGWTLCGIAGLEGWRYFAGKSMHVLLGVQVRGNGTQSVSQLGIRGNEVEYLITWLTTRY